MKFLIKLIVALLVLSYISLIVMLSYMAMIKSIDNKSIFTDSKFFSSGHRFSLLGMDFDDIRYFRAFNVFFFINSLLYYLNISVINPIFSRIVNSNILRISNRVASSLSILLIIYDTWNAFRSFFSIIGITSNFYFFLSNTAGYLVGDIMIKNIYLKYPDLLKYEYIDEPTHDHAFTNEPIQHPPLRRRRNIIHKLLDFFLGLKDETPY